jgi:hypothetical protein
MTRVQTFLPDADFAISAAMLDPVRLGKQRVETLQILRALELPDYGWRNHPAVLMWRGWSPALVAYGLAVVGAWTALGRADSTGPQIAEFAPGVAGLTQAELAATGRLPPWLGDPALHRSHRSALVRKDPAFYRPLVGGDVPDDLPYVWPPPGPAASPDPDTAGEPLWVVRAPVGPVLGLPLAAPTGRRSPKWERQLTAFAERAGVGEAVAVPLDGGAERAVGVLTSEAAEFGGRLQRAVEWSATAPRAAVLRPALLQDPCRVFRVRYDSTCRRTVSGRLASSSTMSAG